MTSNKPHPSRNRNSAPPQAQQQTAPAAEKDEPQQQLPPMAGAGDQAPVVYQLPPEVARRGITEDQWFTLRKSLYPGALPESVVMVWDYCKARRLDPLKKPVHIVPMEVTVNSRQADGSVTKYKEWRDVVMPGIYEYRTTAMRTGLYLGHSEPQYGDDIDAFGVTAPYWCSMVMYRWNEKAARVTEFPVKVFFDEICATKWGDQKGVRVANQKWSQSPIQMLTKCTEAAGLREAFPDELGGEHTIEEMEGRILDDDRVVSDQPPAKTHTDAARDALRQRQQGASAQKSPAQPAATAQPARQKTPEPARAAAQPSAPANPWDDDAPHPAEQEGREKAPQTKDDWLRALRATTDAEACKAIWHAYIDAAELAGLPEPDMDIEATYQLHLEQLTEKQ